MLLPKFGVALCPAGNLEGDLGIKPQAHWFVGSKAAWYTITDALPQHEEYPSEFGARGLARPKIEARPGVTPDGSLDTDPGIRAMAHILTSSRASWDEISDATSQYPEGPPPAR
jgi:hypothetical protein